MQTNHEDASHIETLREITTHRGSILNASVTITAVDAPSTDSGASTLYAVSGIDFSRHPVLQCSNLDTSPPNRGTPQPPAGAEGGPRTLPLPLAFHVGPFDHENPVPNGLTIEALLAIVLDRLAGWQTGRYPCVENAVAASHVEAAIHSLTQRHARAPFRPQS